MSKTSTEVKLRYLKKAYVQWNTRLKPEDFELVEKARGKLSRSEFLTLAATKLLQENKILGQNVANRLEIEEESSGE